jgi:hypothetical protein
VKGSAGRRLSLVLVCLAAWLAVVVAISWIVNPYGVWRAAIVDCARLLGMDWDECGDPAWIVLDAGVRVDAASVDAYLTRQEAARSASRHVDDR